MIHAKVMREDHVVVRPSRLIALPMLAPLLFAPLGCGARSSSDGDAGTTHCLRYLLGFSACVGGPAKLAESLCTDFLLGFTCIHDAGIPDGTPE